MLSRLFLEKKKINIPWNELKNIDQIDGFSREKPILIFKHSTRCSISAIVLNRFERLYRKQALFDLYYLDLISHKNVSDEIAYRYEVRHQSPQVLLINNGKAVFDASHMAISFEQLKTEATKL